MYVERDESDDAYKGLTMCVEALDKISKFFRYKCDIKSKDLQSSKSEEAMSTLNTLNQYRRKLFRILANSNVSQTSTLTKVFVDSFKVT